MLGNFDHFFGKLTKNFFSVMKFHEQGQPTFAQIGMKQQSKEQIGVFSSKKCLKIDSTIIDSSR